MRAALLTLSLVLILGISPTAPRAVSALPEPVPAAARAGTGTTPPQVSWRGLVARASDRAQARGRLTGPARSARVVRAVTAVPGGWHELGRARTAADGSFVLSFTHQWYGARAVRLQVLPTATAPQLLSGAVRSRVTPRYRPLGRADDYALTGTEAGRYRFDPCGVVTWRLNDVSGRHLGYAREGFRQLALATGLRFRYLGRTRHDPARTQGWPADTAVILGFGGDAGTAWPMASFVGWGTPRAVATATDAATRPVVAVRSGGAWVNTALAARSGYRLQPYLQHVVLHELGHVVGLLHARGRDQQLTSFNPALPPRYGAGDLTGLRAVGLEHGCLAGTAPSAWVGGVDDAGGVRLAAPEPARWGTRPAG